MILLKLLPSSRKGLTRNVEDQLESLDDQHRQCGRSPQSPCRGSSEQLMRRPAGELLPCNHPLAGGLSIINLRVESNGISLRLGKFSQRSAKG